MRRRRPARRSCALPLRRAAAAHAAAPLFLNVELFFQHVETNLSLMGFIDA